MPPLLVPKTAWSFLLVFIRDVTEDEFPFLPVRFFTVHVTLHFSAAERDLDMRPITPPEHSLIEGNRLTGTGHFPKNIDAKLRVKPAHRQGRKSMRWFGEDVLDWCFFRPLTPV